MKKYIYLIIGFILGNILFGIFCYASNNILNINIVLQPLKYFFNETEVKITDDYISFIYDGHTYVPLRFIAESLNKNVDWNEENLSIFINDKKSEKIFFNIPNGNYVNGALIIEQDEWIYYLSASRNLIKMRANNSEKTILTEDADYAFIIVDDWIFYRNRKDHYYIYKMKTDGSNKQLIIDKSIWPIYVIDDWIYYDNYYNDIWRIHQNGSNKEKVSDNLLNDLPIPGMLGYSNEWVYYINVSTNKKNQLLKMNINNTQEIVKISENIDDEFLTNYVSMYYDNYIYYCDYDRKMNRINLNTGAYEKLDKLDPIYDRLWNSYNISDGYIYYSNENDAGKLYKSKLDGTEKEKLSDIVPSTINIINNWIYFLNPQDSKGTIYKIRIDGTEQEIVQ